MTLFLLIIGVVLFLVIPILIIFRKNLKIETEVLTVLITAILAVEGYVFTSIENSRQAHERLLQEKNIALWQDQKKLSFEFIDFLDKEFFFNSIMQGNNVNSWEYKNQSEKLMHGLNLFYGRLYLIADTSFLLRLNEILDKPVTHAQRYYLLSQISLQMLKLINNEVDPIRDAPYVSLNVKDVPVVSNGKRFSTFEEMKEVYSYIERGDATSTYRALPSFHLSEE